MGHEITEITKIYKDSLHIPHFIQTARERSKTLRALIEGDKFKDELSKIEHIEKSESKWKAREKYSRSIVDLNARLMLMLDNVYSATGGSKRYDISNKVSKREIINKLSNIRGNNTLERWLQDYWMPIYHTDPNGVLLMEWKDEDVYPTYKSINRIRNYEADGRNVKWILFEPKKKFDSKGSLKETVRFIDDSFDRTFLIQGEQLIEIKELTFPVPFDKCPAIVNSNLVKIGTEIRLSPFEKIIELQQEYLRDQSILTIVKFLNGFKNLIRPKILCPECHGTKKNGENVCKSCSGTGWLINRDATDEIVFPIDLDNPDQKMPDAKSFAAWFGLDTETWDQYRGELKVLEILMYESIWGTHYTSQENKTATAKLIDTQPAINKLNKYSDVAEWTEWQISNWVAQYISKNTTGDNQVQISYGRRFILDPPDELLKKYIEAKKENTAITVLDRMLNEYLTAKYKNDPEQLFTELVKKDLEPFIHYDVKTVFDIFGQEAAQFKMLFDEWWETLQPDEIKKEVNKLNENYKSWFKLKLKEHGENSSSEEV